MFLVGLTGGVATGKSTVSRFFNGLGVPVLDADLMARRIVEPGKPAYKRIRSEFGASFFDPDSGELDRAALRRLIFSDDAARAKLNTITHPEIYKELCWEAVKCSLQGHQFVVMDLPLLFEAGVMVGWMHQIIVVTCEEDLQLQRLMEQRRLSEHESKLMIAAQMPLDKKERQAQFVIENSGGLQDTKEQVVEIYMRLRQSKFHWGVRVAVGVAVGGVVSLAWFVGKKVLGGGGGSGPQLSPEPVIPWRHIA